MNWGLARDLWRNIVAEPHLNGTRASYLLVELCNGLRLPEFVPRLWRVFLLLVQERFQGIQEGLVHLWYLGRAARLAGRVVGREIGCHLCSFN